MGLDMYLHKVTFIGANYEHNEIRGVINLTKFGKRIPIELNKIVEIEETAIYWRKANAIHGWFVREVQEGNDDCRTYEVSVKKLKELLDLVNEVLKDRDPERAVRLLPPVPGFFFGSNDIDEYYWEDMEQTAKELEALLKEDEENKANPELAEPSSWFTYQSSW